MSPWMLVVLPALALVLAFRALASSRGIRPSLLTPVLALVTVFVYLWISFAVASIWVKLLLMASIGPTLMVLSNASWRHDKHLAQQSRDSEASRILARVTEGAREHPAPAFALYLRPFATLARLLSQPASAGGPDIPGHLDLETLLFRALLPWCPLVALGRPGEIEGPGRVEVPEEHWQEAVDALASHTRLLILVPSYHAGTSWEMAWVRRRGALQKTLFVMPESMAAGGGVVFYEKPDLFSEARIQQYDASEHFIDFPDEWTKTVDAARALGFDFPVYRADGALFTLDDSGRVADLQPLALSGRARRVTHLRQAVEHLGLASRLTRNTSD